MMLAAADDQDLVASTRTGDERAFEELYERYRGPIRAFALRLTRDADRADDLTQEVFISALRRLRETDRQIVFRPWIYEIARNACIDEYRRSKRVNEVPIERDGVDSWLDHLAGGPSPEVAMESKLALEDLQGAFRGLSERHHRIIVARELEGKSYRQIGQELGMSQVVVESTLFRARRKLTEEFEDLSSGRRCRHVREIIGSEDARPARLGIRERRTVSRHLQHCRPCRREALAVGFELHPRRSRRLEKVAAALFPVPLVRLFRRGGAAASSAARAAHQGAMTITSPLAAASSIGSGRFVAAAATALAAVVGGGLVAGVDQSPAHSVSQGALRGARITVSHRVTAVHAAGAGFPATWVAPGASANAARRPQGTRPGTRHRAAGTVGSRRSTLQAAQTQIVHSAVTDAKSQGAGSTLGSRGPLGGPGGSGISVPKLGSPSLPSLPTGGSGGLPTVGSVTSAAGASGTSSIPGGVAKGSTSKLPSAAEPSSGV